MGSALLFTALVTLRFAAIWFLSLCAVMCAFPQSSRPYLLAALVAACIVAAPTLKVRLSNG